jgi:chromosome segregation ATPase
MPPEEQPGQVPTAEPQEPQAGDSGNDEIAKLRQEAAKWRTQYRDAQKQIKEYEPLATKYSEMQEAQKGEAEKLAERLAALEGQLSQAQAQAERAKNERRLIVLATRAGVSAETLQYLDVSKFDLDDEEATITALSALVPAKPANSGGISNPARASGDNKQEDLRAWWDGRGKKNYIFGDK